MKNVKVSQSDLENLEAPIRLLLVAPSLRILGGQAVQANYLLDHLSRESQFRVSFVDDRDCRLLATEVMNNRVQCEQ